MAKFVERVLVWLLEKLPHVGHVSIMTDDDLKELERQTEKIFTSEVVEKRRGLH